MTDQIISINERVATAVFQRLVAASQDLTPGGVIEICDAYDWTVPGVNEGFHRFFFECRPNLAPFAVRDGKLLLTTPDHHARRLKASQGNMASLFGYEIAVLV